MREGRFEDDRRRAGSAWPWPEAVPAQRMVWSRTPAAWSLRPVAWSLSALILAGCGNPPRGSTARNDLAAMQTATVTIEDHAQRKHVIQVWVARTLAEQTLGLMNVTEDEIGHNQGMLFVFGNDAVRAFWMRNTIIPLDIAYIRSDGTIVRTWTMRALDESTYSSIEPARFALELRAGELAAQGITAGDRVEVPASVLN